MKVNNRNGLHRRLVASDTLRPDFTWHAVPGRAGVAPSGVSTVHVGIDTGPPSHRIAGRADERAFIVEVEVSRAEELPRLAGEPLVSSLGLVLLMVGKPPISFAEEGVSDIGINTTLKDCPGRRFAVKPAVGGDY